MQHFVFLVFFARGFRPQVLAEFAKQQISWHREAVWEPLGSGLVVSFVVFWLNLPTSRGTTKCRGCLWSGTRLVPLISEPPWKNILLRQNHSSFSEVRISVGWRSDNIPCLTIDSVFIGQLCASMILEISIIQLLLTSSVLPLRHWWKNIL